MTVNNAIYTKNNLKHDTTESYLIDYTQLHINTSYIKYTQTIQNMNSAALT